VLLVGRSAPCRPSARGEWHLAARDRGRPARASQIVDYTLTSDRDELEALHDFLSGQGVPTLALVYCKTSAAGGGRAAVPPRSVCREQHAEYVAWLDAHRVPFLLVGPGTVRGARFAPPARHGGGNARDVASAAAYNGSSMTAVGHRLLASAVAGALLLHCRQLVPARPGQGRPEQLCRLGRHMDELLVPGRGGGFARHDPGYGRTPGLLANAVGASVVLQLRGGPLRAGYVSVGYERGWRNQGIDGLLACQRGCSCTPQLLNTSNERRETVNVLSSPTYVEAPCTLAVSVISTRPHATGRVFLTSAILSSSSRQTSGLQLEIADVAARGYHVANSA